MLKMLKARNLISIIAIILYSCIGFAGAPNYTTFQTKILAPSGLPLENPAVNFRFTILDTVGTCVLYIEDYVAVNIPGSAGVVSFSLGSGTKSYPGTATLMNEVFNVYAKCAATRADNLRYQFLSYVCQYQRCAIF